MTTNEVLYEMIKADLGSDPYFKSSAPQAVFHLIAREGGIICGMEFVPEIVGLVEERFFLRSSKPDEPERIYANYFKRDGDEIKGEDILAAFTGNAEVLLKAERTICNILSELSGIATHTRKLVSEAGGEVALLDTRKGNALMRPFHKYAVGIGGGGKHRSGFFDGVMVKDNDIAVYGGVASAIDRRLERKKHLTKLEVEVKSFDELAAVLADGRADVIMLDNMNPKQLEQAVDMIRHSTGKYVIEASGVRGYDLKEIARTGVEAISLSAITREAKPIDISMKVVK